MCETILTVVARLATTGSTTTFGDPCLFDLPTGHIWISDLEEGDFNFRINSTKVLFDLVCVLRMPQSDVTIGIQRLNLKSFK